MLDRLTGLSQTSKIKRLIDNRDNAQSFGCRQDIMKIFDCHSHWGTKRGYIFRTEAELARQEQIWKTKATFFTEDEQVEYFRKSNVQGPA